MQGAAYVDSDLGRRERDLEGQLERAQRRLRVETIAGKPRARRIVGALEGELERVRRDRRERGEL